ncbi:hypothetical protein ACW0JT_00060 [Arthrobacter sp. SA17]
MFKTSGPSPLCDGSEDSVVEVCPSDDFELDLDSGLLCETVQRRFQLGRGVIQAVALV